MLTWLLAFLIALGIVLTVRELSRKLADLLRELRELNARVAVISRVWHQTNCKDAYDDEDNDDPQYDELVQDELKR